MSPAARLEEILWSGVLRAFHSHTSAHPVVRFSRATIHSAAHMIRTGYGPWGLIVSRQSVYAAGGVPGLVRQTGGVRTSSADLRHRAVRLDPPRSDCLMNVNGELLLTLTSDLAQRSRWVY